ncbi:DUF2157 domain-containing protein [Lacinutrix undariae]
MKDIEREDIQIISTHSNWSQTGIDVVLKKEIYNDKQAWLKFLKVLFLSLGVGFTTAGILFFFAYNWADLNKFVKLGLIEFLIIAITLIVVCATINLNVKKILLTSAVMLVGVLFAVFGQIYQTGANAYDFFLGWSMAVVLWVVISDFAPLWLIFVILINTTFILYSDQVAHDWSLVFVCTSLFIINLLFLSIALFIPQIKDTIKAPLWFTHVLTLIVVFFATMGIGSGIFDDYPIEMLILTIATIAVYTIAIRYGIKEKNGFYLSVFPFSIIIIITTLLASVMNDIGMLLVISLFVITSVTLVIKNLINLNKNG